MLQILIFRELTVEVYCNVRDLQESYEIDMEAKIWKKENSKGVRDKAGLR